MPARRHNVSQALLSLNIRDRRNTWFAEELVDNLVSLRNETLLNERAREYYPFALFNESHCLRLPIGVIFRMALEENRMNALQWLNSTLPTFNTNDDPNNLALFSALGPSDSSMQMLFSSLQQRLLALPYHYVTFEVFTEKVLLVWIFRHTHYFPTRMPSQIEKRWRAAFMSLEQRDFESLGPEPFRELDHLQSSEV
jgi:hypothetical protein